MSGPKSSTYNVDPKVLRRLMLEAEHQREMANIKNEACRKADELFNKMKAAVSSAGTVYKDENSLSAIREMLEKIGKAQIEGMSDERLTSMQNELLHFDAELSDSDKLRIKQLDSELSGLLSKGVSISVNRVDSDISAQENDTVSKAEKFDEEQKERLFRMAVEALYTEAAMLDIDEPLPEYDPENSEKLIRQIQRRTEELQKIREKNTANEYIYSTALQVMKEMGYSMLGEKQVKGNVSLRSSLFKINDKTAFNITQSSDGKIVYEVVGVNDTGILSGELTDEIEKMMLTMCDKEYEEFLQKLASKGITPTEKHKRLPPNRQFASVKNILDYLVDDDKNDTRADAAESSVSSTSSKKASVNLKKERRTQHNGAN